MRAPIRFVALPALLLVAVAACQNSQTTDPAPNPPNNGPPSGPPLGQGIVVADGIEYQADVQVMESFPVQLAADVKVTNQTEAPVTLVFADGCVAMLRAYHAGGETPVWDQRRDVACTLALVPLELAAGESRTFRTPNASAADILGTSLSDGSYRITVYLRPDNTEVEINAGNTELAIPR